MNKIKIHNPVLSNYLIVIYNCDYEKLNKYLKKEYNIGIENNEYNNGCFFKAEADESEYYFIWIEKPHKDSYTYSLVAHEIVHFLFQLFDDRGINIDKENDETFAYHLQFYLKEIFEKIYKR